ncbi:MAG TPA: fibronectin type III-like domain-contianing protein, partial [Variovorax sp.]
VRDAPALLVTWFLGSQTGPAVADILFGDASPSARLPVGFPQTPGQVPYYYAHKRTGRPELDADPNLPYKARYLDATNEALYPFGFGLGYAPVRYTALEVSPARLPWNGALRIKARIGNEGQRDVEEVAQLYIGERAASVTRPVRELKAFRKVRVPAGGSTEVEFSLSRADLMFIGQDLQPTVEPGQFDLWVGPSAVAGLHAGFELLPP